MKQDKKTKLAYTAGLLDGEGCISIGKHTPTSGSPQYQLSVRVSQKDGSAIDFLSGNFGGSVNIQSQSKATFATGDKEKDWIYSWTVEGTKAIFLLKQVLPFLRLKKKQAELAIQFQQRKTFGKKKTKENQKTFASLPEHEIEIREKMFQKMKELKREWSKSKNPNVVEYTFKSMVQE